jgi:hypothetical protein
LHKALAPFALKEVTEISAAKFLRARRGLGDLASVWLKYPAVSVAIARFQNRLKTERSLQRRVKQIEKLLKVEM